MPVINKVTALDNTTEWYNFVDNKVKDWLASSQKALLAMT